MTAPPPFCSCGCHHPPGTPCPPAPPCPPTPMPPPGAWGNRLQQCWQEIEQFRAFLQQILGDVTRYGPIIGDVTGKPAATGQVGEYVTNTVTGSFTAATQTQSVSAIILQPGDWDVEAAVTFNGVVGTPLNMTGAAFILNPPPAGASSNMYTVDALTHTAAAAGTSAIADANGWAQLISARAQILSSVPALLAFNLTTNLTATA